MAQTLGVNIKAVTFTLRVATSFMVSATVSYCGLVGFVGLVMPHMLRLVFGPDHRVLVPACVFGGGTYMVFCDLLAPTFPKTRRDTCRCYNRHDRCPAFYIFIEKIQQMNMTITAKNLSHSFGENIVLRNVSFHIPKRDFFIIIGPNVSGKTTLMKIISGNSKASKR